VQKHTVYIESTIPSYLTAKVPRDPIHLLRQNETKLWWKTILPKLHPVISSFVLKEINDGDISAAKRRLEAVEGFEVLQSNATIEALADRLINELHIPKNAKTDALHLATAVVYEIDFVLSWNFDHIVGAPIRKTFSEIGLELGLKMPTLTTPTDFLGGKI